MSPKEEQDVKIPVESVEEVEAADAVEATEVEEETAASAEAEVVQDAEPEADAPAMTEEEMVEAAIRAGEEAAENDFKFKYEKLADELAAVRKELEEAAAAKEAAEASAKDAVERHARLQADWENYRRRTARERNEERERATEKLVMALLPAIDDIERALAHARTQELSESFSQFVDGVDAVRVKIMGVLEHEGAEVIDPAGEPFDCNVHQAVGRVEDAERYDETVNDVYQKGYRMGGKVLRPAMVTVTYGGPARPAPQPEAEADTEAEADE